MASNVQYGWTQLNTQRLPWRRASLWRAVTVLNERPLYAGVLIIAAMVAAGLVTEWHAAPTVLRLAVYVCSVPSAAAGVVMTFRDLR